ncbi:MAG: recombinase family protein [Hornefia butyriciproducens]|uniref:recombinase family protein n=1 Tax=Hornefia butyriciproducens TaxID=2652293 RepID=UPI002A754C50|nr:recombinase family protein [Hornefia butyriciproducens]MDY2990582.1 recombinase family protein [Hornefia butyriciproducens]
MKVNRIERRRIEQTRKRVCAYVRVSTDSDEQEDSLVNQTSYFKRFIARHPEWEFAGIYADQGITGYSEKRPEFQRMLSDAREGKIDMIIVKSVSRFARNTETVLRVSREMKGLGVAIFFQLQNINTMTQAGELMLTILAAFAQAESESNSANVRMTIQNKFKKGEPVWNLAGLYGYTEDRDGEVIIDEDEAKVIRLMYNLAEEGIWASKIAGYLNEQRLLTRKGCNWSGGQVRKTLRHEAYKGDRILQKTFKDARRKTRKNTGEKDQWYLTDTHPAIVSREQWDAVQKVLDERSQAYTQKKPVEKKKHHPHSRYPLSGKLYCPYCGCLLYHKWETDQSFEYWMCSTRLKWSPESCPGVYVPAKFLKGWEGIDEELVVVQYKDEYGMDRVEAYPKVEWEQEHAYSNEFHRPKPEKKEKPKKRDVAKRKHPDTPEGRRYTRATYPHSKKLYCPYCGRVMIHKWDGGVPYWQCGSQRNHYKHPEEPICKMKYLPCEISDTWGRLEKPVTVIPFTDDVGNRFFTYMDKEEYEASEECLYGKD